MKRIVMVAILIAIWASVSACGGPSPESMAGQVQSHSTDELAGTSTDKIVEAFGMVCGELDEEGVAQLVADGMTSDVDEGDVVLLVGGAVRTTCTKYADQFDDMFGDTFDKMMEN